jgi:DNA-binding MarR family transcriptional regulator
MPATKTATKPPIHQQTAAISSMLGDFVRNLLYVEDPTAELPLRQLHVCHTLLSGPRSMTDLAVELKISPSATTQIADRLERAGLVMRIADERDRRVRCLKLTAEGTRAMKSREAIREARLAAVCKRLTSDERQQVIQAFEFLRQAIHNHDSSAVKSR